MKIAVQMDPMSSVNLDSDSTICLIEEAVTRGFEVSHYTPKNLILKDSGLYADVSLISIIEGKIELGDQHNVLLEEFDVVLMRQDPPVNMHYLTYTYMLDRIKDKVLIVNDSTAVREMPEKLFALNKFSNYMPETVVLEEVGSALNFLSKHGEVVVKPLYGCGGEGIKKFDTNGMNEFKIYFEKLVRQSSAPVMVQRFLKNVSKGDKRVILVDGKIMGAINRIPPKDSFHANMVLGGIPSNTKLTEREREISEVVGKELKQHGVIFAGLDIIDGFLTEINITSPTGIKSINELERLVGNDKIESKIWDVIQKKLEKK
jgi:glutathione synthase